MTDGADRLYERVLVLRCQTRDDAAFAELVGCYDRRLRFYLRKMLPDAHRAEDVLQEVWLDVFRGLPRLADPAAFPAWLYRVARDRVFRMLRGRRPPTCSLENIDVAEEAVAASDWTEEDVGRVHAALDELAPEHREVLLLRFLEDMGYEDIARVACCPVGTVRSRLHYAKRALRRILERMKPHE